MKTTSIKLFKRPFALSALTCACAAMMFILSSCGEGGQATSQTSASESGAEDDIDGAGQTAQSEFPAHLNFYNDLFARSNCPASFTDGIVTGPLTCTQFKAAVIGFGNMYTHVSGTELTYEPTKFPFDAQNAGMLIDLLQTYGGQTRYGLVFHYGYRVQSGKGEIVYILSKGELSPSQSDPVGEVTYCAFENGENDQTQAHYISLEPHKGKPYRVIDQAEFKVMTELYFGNIEYDGAALSENNARMVYHEADSLYAFYEQYKDENNLHLYIGHGALDNSEVGEVLHTPCLAFGNAAEFFEMDNVLQGPTFRRKGLDIGHLCPPHCKQPVSQCVGK